MRRSQLIGSLAALALAAAGGARAASEPFFAPAQPSGSIVVKLYPMENVAAGTPTLVTFGLPLTRGSLTPAQVSTVRVLKNGVELPAYVEARTPWRHLTNAAVDGQSVRVARVQIQYSFTQTNTTQTLADPATARFEEITVDWGVAPRTQNRTLSPPRNGWHLVTSGTFVAADNVREPDVFAVLPSAHLTKGVFRPRMAPTIAAVGEARDNPNDMLSMSFPGYTEYDYAQKNFYYGALSTPYKTDYLPWLFDRATTMYVLYLRTGFLRPLREAVRASDFYRSRITAGGDFTMRPGDVKYRNNECLALMQLLTGDDFEAAKVAAIADTMTGSFGARWSPSLSGWTERNIGTRLLSVLVAYELTGEARFKTAVTNTVNDAIWHQDGGGGNIPAGRVDGGLYHTGNQHTFQDCGSEIGDPADCTRLMASPWMSVLLGDPMVRAYAVSEDARIATFTRRLASFMMAASRMGSSDYGGTLRYPDYLMRYDGATVTRSGSDVQHTIDTGSIAAWGAYFADRAGQRNLQLEELANDLYEAFDVGCNVQTSPGSANPFPSSPARRYSWNYRPSGSFSWIMNNLGGSGPANPTVTLTAPADGATFTAPASITLSANASVAGATITKVEFFQGATKLGEDATAPYSFSWANVPAGSYVLTARATASTGTSATSPPRTVHVQSAGCGVSRPGAIYNQAFPAQSGTFTVIANATPRAVGGTLGDTGVGINTAPPQGETSSFHTAATVRFNTANQRIEARSASTFPATTIAWTAGQTYRIRLVVNMTARNYAAYVTPPGGSELTIGTGLLFRSNYDGVASFNNLRGAVDAGSIEVCPLTLPGSGSDTTPPAASVTAPAAGATLAGVVTLSANASDNVGVAGVQFLVDGVAVGAEDTTAPYSISFDTRTRPNGAHTIGARARDAAGNQGNATPVNVTFRNCGTSTTGSIYNQTFTPQSGTFTVVVDATPTAVGGVLEDTGVGLNTSPPQGDANSFQTAATVRFNTVNQRIEPRNNLTYPTTNVAWSAGQTYRIRFVVNVGTRTYSAFATPPGGAEQPLGTGLAFRSINYGSVTSLNNLNGAVDAGSIVVCPVTLP